MNNLSQLASPFEKEKPYSYPTGIVLDWNGHTLFRGAKDECIDYAKLCHRNVDQVRIYYPHNYVADEVYVTPTVAYTQQQLGMLWDVNNRVFI